MHRALVIKAQKRTQPKCLSIDERINKMWNTHTMEYYPALKRSEVLIYATTWLNLKTLC